MADTWRQRNREKVNAWARAWNKKNPKKAAAAQRKCKTGYTQELFAARLASQNNKCAICFQPFVKEPHADHCHKTGQHRGLLCRGCNLILGWAKDDETTLKSAIQYLQVWKTK